jgi:hypothetical protein
MSGEQSIDIGIYVVKVLYSSISLFTPTISSFQARSSYLSGIGSDSKKDIGFPFGNSL